MAHSPMVPNDLGCMVFISHAVEDRREAEAACEHLEGRGFKCWIAPRDIPEGSNYLASIADAIRRASSMLVLLSRHAAASAHVPRELERALDCDVPIVGVRLDGFPMSGALEYSVATSQLVNVAAGPFHQHLHRIEHAIRHAEAGVTASPGMGDGPAPDVHELRRRLIAARTHHEIRSLWVLAMDLSRREPRNVEARVLLDQLERLTTHPGPPMGPPPELAMGRPLSARAFPLRHVLRVAMLAILVVVVIMLIRRC